MVIKEVTIKNLSGLGSRKAAVFIQKASKYKSSIWVEKGERKANAKSLLGLLSLSIEGGGRILLIADGEDESAAVKELEDFLSTDQGYDD